MKQNDRLSKTRDLRLDLFRGLANWAIFLGHVLGTTVLAWFTTRHAAGLALMTAVAYYRSWSKGIDRPVADGGQRSDPQMACQQSTAGVQAASSSARQRRLDD